MFVLVCVLNFGWVVVVFVMLVVLCFLCFT